MKNILGKVGRFSTSNKTWDQIWEQVEAKVGDRIIFEVRFKTHDIKTLIARPAFRKLDEICK